MADLIGLIYAGLVSVGGIFGYLKTGRFLSMSKKGYSSRDSECVFVEKRIYKQQLFICCQTKADLTNKTSGKNIVSITF